MTVKQAFPPSVMPDATLLILGSLPGDVSLAAQQYYANPTNQFWRLVGSVVDTDLSALDYHERLERLADFGVGLWDVVQSARRLGSGDGAIRDHQANDLRLFVTGLPKLRAVAFNGAAAARIGRKQLGQRTGLDLVNLPSSSAAYCLISMAAKLERWLALKAFVNADCRGICR